MLRRRAVWQPLGGGALLVVLLLVAGSGVEWQDASMLFLTLACMAAFGYGADTADRDLKSLSGRFAAIGLAVSAVYFGIDYLTALLFRPGGASWQWEYVLSMLLVAGFIYAVLLFGRARW
jgi:hypothetical protein